MPVMHLNLETEEHDFVVTVDGDFIPSQGDYVHVDEESYLNTLGIPIGKYKVTEPRVLDGDGNAHVYIKPVEK